MIFYGLIGLVALVAGAVAAVAGFGIGSLLTPTLGWQYGVKLAVAAVAIPHVLGTAFRFWMIRKHVDRAVLISFGLASAVGGLAGALLHTVLKSPVLGFVLGLLLIYAGAVGVAGAKRRVLQGVWAWGAGLASGLFGGLVGNQGGIRSAALLSFGLSKEAFVATATAVALVVDGARLPVYLATQWSALWRIWPAIAVCSAGVLLGTWFGRPVLARIPEPVFNRVVSGIILVLGIGLVAQTWR